MKQWIAGAAAIVIILAIVASVIAWEVSIWRECRSDHSWSYCVRLISK